MPRCNCNYCKVERYLAEAKRSSSRVVTLHNKDLGGTDLYVIPDEIKVPKAKDMKLIKKYLKEWFREIPYKCEVQKNVVINKDPNHNIF